ncbi:transposase [Fulvivirga maritima]|uniref:transposase n=1 Tax=Fulvivirga maritima TaxID=2904247 RepID=UPI001F45F10E|nr:transposase [Fulvivirga maritima]UII27629.1 transposase [Fulvivirga maritima]
MRDQELFQPQDYLTPKWYLFKNSKLGKVYNTIPWSQLSECLPKENRGPGAPRWFSAQGMFGLMFLKSYLNLSDEKLIERFNTDWSLQLFCNKLLDDNQRIKDKAILSRIRTYMADNTDWQQLQEVLIHHWKRDMNNTHVLLMDATCYESYIRFPTDVKLLWESCQWVFEKQLYRWSKILGVKRPRSKYIDQKRKQMSYDRSRKKTYKAGRKRKKALIYLLSKGLGQLQYLLNENPQIQLHFQERSYLKTIKKVLEQQQFLQHHPAKELKNRIVSLPRPYVRPIVRGKETKRVEFGMKAHMLQVDGICFIDAMEFRAFNESTRLKISSLKHRSIFGSLHQLGADRIYATNANRKYLTVRKVFTCFPKKGPKINKPQESKLRSLISNQRATVMEGSFGTHKTAYGLNKIKVKGEKREMIHVFFAVMMANAVKMSKKKSENIPLLQAA